MEKDIHDEQQIKKMSTKRVTAVRKTSKKTQEDIEWLTDAIQAMGLEEFMDYIRSPWKMLWPNFIAGVARGFGALVGASIVIAIIGWSLTLIIDLPLIGQKLEPYVTNVQTEFKKYTETTNYKPNFENMEKLLIDIRNNTSK